jgi:hypothetical protein
MKCKLISCTRLFGSVLFACFFVFNAAAQSSLAREKSIVQPSSDGWFYLTILIVLTGLGGAYFFWRKSRAKIEQPQYNYKNQAKDGYNNGAYEFADVDADRELEWLRKKKKSSGKDKTSAGKRKSRKREHQSPIGLNGEIDAQYTRTFQEKMRRLQYGQLPINSFNALTPAPSFEPLSLSNDEGLLSAIEQTNEEGEEDEAVRELAVRILAAFRTSNSIDALYQVALYDLAASVRAKAVTALADFDHESVFEAILLACADPTREVRASAARGLFRLNFDRAGAWTRLIETHDEFRMSHAARAAVESGIVHKSFDRLIHEDVKISYEAFCLTALMIRSGEVQEIFEAIRNNKDERVKFALLHVLKVIKDERSLEKLNELYREGKCPSDVLDRARDVIASLEEVRA